MSKRSVHIESAMTAYVYGYWQGWEQQGFGSPTSPIQKETPSFLKTKVEHAMFDRGHAHGLFDKSYGRERSTSFKLPSVKYLLEVTRMEEQGQLVLPPEVTR